MDDATIIALLLGLITLFFATANIVLYLVMGNIKQNKEATKDAHKRLDELIKENNKERTEDMKEIRQHFTKLDVAIARLLTKAGLAEIKEEEES